MKLNHKIINDLHYYTVTSSRFFNGSQISKKNIQKVIDFAYEMCFGKGFHRNQRSGGQYGRKNGEKFCNTFQGKLAEVVLHDYFVSNQIFCHEPDFRILGEGLWDDSDFEIYGNKINVKSVASQSNLLLLEVDDWNTEGHYLPNLVSNSGATAQYDYFILVRINPDIKKIFKTEKIMFTDQIDKTHIEDLIYKNNWSYDIPGYCTNEDFLNAILTKNIIPKNAMLNNYTKMDASNYYIQSGDMRVITDLVKELKR